MDKSLAILVDSFHIERVIDEYGLDRSSSCVVVIANDFSLKEAGGEKKVFNPGFIKLKSQKMESAVRLFVTVVYIFFKYLLFKRYRTVIGDGYPYAGAAALARALRLSKVRELIYLSGDWFQAGAKSSGFNIVDFANEKVFPWVDGMIAKRSDRIVNFHASIAEARNLYLGAPLLNQDIFPLRYINRSSSEQMQSSCVILHLGKVHESSGVSRFADVLIKNDLHTKFRMDFVGYETEAMRRFMAKYSDLFATGVFKHIGFVERDNYPQVLAGYFCGINLFDCKVVHSKFTIQAKIIDYVEHCIPILTSHLSGEHAMQLVRDRAAGLITDSSEKSIVESINKLYANQQYFKENLLSLTTRDS